MQWHRETTCYFGPITSMIYEIYFVCQVLILSLAYYISFLMFCKT